jgi:hypothetical protein
LIVDVQPALGLFADCVDNESAQLALSSIAAGLETALSSSPPPATIDFWDACGAQRIPKSLYQPLPSSPNVLLLHETTTCSGNDTLTPTTVSTLVRIPEAIFTLFLVFFCGIVAFLLSFITFTEFAYGAEPEDMDEVDVSVISSQQFRFF